jgi:hypothetical protein
MQRGGRQSKAAALVRSPSCSRQPMAKAATDRAGGRVACFRPWAAKAKAASSGGRKVEMDGSGLTGAEPFDARSQINVGIHGTEILSLKKLDILAAPLILFNLNIYTAHKYSN